MMEGRNNITKEKYLTLSISAESVEDAFTKFAKLDIEVSAVIKRINGMETPPMTAVERLEVLADIFSDGSETQSFYQKANINNHDLETFNFSWMVKQGLTTKDLIGPASFKFTKDHFEIGNKVAKSLFIDNLPTFMNSNVLSDITEINTNLLVSINFNKLRQDKALSLLKNQSVNINSNVVDAQKKAAKAGYSPDLISPELKMHRQKRKSLWMMSRKEIKA